MKAMRVRRQQPTRFRQVRQGDVLPVYRSQRWACCDCGLVHTMVFTWAKKGLVVKVLRNEKWSAISRRRKKHPFTRTRR